MNRTTEKPNRNRKRKNIIGKCCQESAALLVIDTVVTEVIWVYLSVHTGGKSFLKEEYQTNINKSLRKKKSNKNQIKEKLFGKRPNKEFLRGVYMIAAVDDECAI